MWRYRMAVFSIYKEENVVSLCWEKEFTVLLLNILRDLYHHVRHAGDE